MYWNIQQSRLKPTLCYTYFIMSGLCFTIVLSLFRYRYRHHRHFSFFFSFMRTVKERACICICVSNGQCSLDWEINSNSRKVAAPLITTFNILFSLLFLKKKAIVSLPKCQELHSESREIITSFLVYTIRFDDSHNLCVIFLTHTHKNTEFHFCAMDRNLSVYIDGFVFFVVFFSIWMNEASTRYDRTLEAKNVVYAWLMVVWVDQTESKYIDRSDGRIHTHTHTYSHKLSLSLS